MTVCRGGYGYVRPVKPDHAPIAEADLLGCWNDPAWRTSLHCRIAVAGRHSV